MLYKAALRAELTARLAELEAARSKIEITQTSVAAATEDLRVQQERYRLGASTIVDVLTSQEALNQAEVDVVVARFDYLRAKAQAGFRAYASSSDRATITAKIEDDHHLMDNILEL